MSCTFFNWVFEEQWQENVVTDTLEFLETITGAFTYFVLLDIICGPSFSLLNELYSPSLMYFAWKVMSGVHNFSRFSCFVNLSVQSG